MASRESSRKFRSLLSTFRSPDTKSALNLDFPNLAASPPRIKYHQDIHIQRHEGLHYQNRIPNEAFNIADDDIPLDAFDRELLLHLDQDQQDLENPGFKLNEVNDVPRPGPFSTPLHRGRSTAFSSSNSFVTPPLRHLASSSSALEPPSSPFPNITGDKQGTFQEEEDATVYKSPHWPSTGFPVTPSPLSSFRRPASITLSHSPEIQLNHAPPMVQGISLVPTREVSDRFRSIFPFPVFNAIQSKTFPVIFHTSDNLVLSSPTGSGKTVIMELSICKLVTDLNDSRFKVIYLAPTKSLCSERFRDWRAKFGPLDLHCAELTGDTDQLQMRNVQQASIIITTPEKWDSMTRKWKDHIRLMRLIKLVLIDEVHILKEARGATLEAVVSRMKSVSSNVRFVALSATVPNSEDIAEWLGKDSTNQHLPAHRERFGEEFRPVKLQKFVYGYQNNGNDFVFDRVCETKLPEVLAKHSSKKPIMIFCCTRNSAIATSKNLAKLWISTTDSRRLWCSPTKTVQVQNAELHGIVFTGVAFHHAGLDSNDRHTIEKGFLDGQINVICCTSTLAVGVNLPCHLVVIKNTVSWQDGGCKEYSDLEVMQMLGRAGRPQFDNSAVGVILTRKDRAEHYEKLVAGSEPLESCLHLNLTDHLNAEIGLGTITDVESAVRWLLGTFFFVRLQRNPTYYKLKEGGNRADEEELLRKICEKHLELLQQNDLVTSEAPLKSTELGDAMARYYVKFETMKLFLSLPLKAKISEILSVIAQADEFREIRLKAGERSLYKEINKAPAIKFPIKVDIGLSSHKISLLIQSELGAVEMPSHEQYQKHRLSFQQDRRMVFTHVNRIIRCIIDCQLARGDPVSTRHALELSRSLGAKAWDDSPLHLKQIDQIGIVAVRKLANAGITDVDTLEAAEPIRIETLLSRNPPFGMKVLARVAEFPKPRVSLKEVEKDTKPGKVPRVKFKANIGFLNEKVPLYFQKRQVYLCFLAETSDGRIVDFRRINANKLQNGQEILLTTEVKSPLQSITCTVMCDEIAGTMRQAEMKPFLPKSLFLLCKGETAEGPNTTKCIPAIFHTNINKKPEKNPYQHQGSSELSDDPLNYSDLAEDFDDFLETKKNDIMTARSIQRPVLAAVKKKMSRGSSLTTLEAIQFDNGKWACNHRCKDKTACKHLCCREGTDHPPKLSKRQEPKGIMEDDSQSSLKTPNDATPYEQNHIEIIDLTTPEPTREKTSIKNKKKTKERRSLSISSLLQNAIEPLRSSTHLNDAKMRDQNPSQEEEFEEFEALIGLSRSLSPNNGTSGGCEKQRETPSCCTPGTIETKFESTTYSEIDCMAENGGDESGPFVRAENGYNGDHKRGDFGKWSQLENFLPHEVDDIPIHAFSAYKEPIAQSDALSNSVIPNNIILQKESSQHSVVLHGEQKQEASIDTETPMAERLEVEHLKLIKDEVHSTPLGIPIKKRKLNQGDQPFSGRISTFSFQQQSLSPKIERIKDIDPSVLEEFGDVAEFY